MNVVAHQYELMELKSLFGTIFAKHVQQEIA